MSNTIDVCQTGYDYEQYQLNELENENMKLKKQLEIATKVLKSFIPDDLTDGGFGEMYESVIRDCEKALKEMEDVE